MANTKQASKRVRQAESKRLHNASRRSTLRTFIKKVKYALLEKDAVTAEEAFKKAVPFIDRMATKKIIHKNKAARYKSRLNAQIKALKVAQ